MTNTFLLLNLDFQVYLYSIELICANGYLGSVWKNYMTTHDHSDGIIPKGDNPCNRDECWRLVQENVPKIQANGIYWNYVGPACKAIVNPQYLLTDDGSWPDSFPDSPDGVQLCILKSILGEFKLKFYFMFAKKFDIF